VQVFIDDFCGRFVYKLLWAKNQRRFEAVLAGIRASIVIEVGTREEWQKADSLLHRRRLTPGFVHCRTYAGGHVGVVAWFWWLDR